MSSEIAMTNTGELEVNNRRRRRTFPKSDPNHTKKTWSRQSRKELKRKRKLGRK